MEIQLKPWNFVPIFFSILASCTDTENVNNKVENTPDDYNSFIDELLSILLESQPDSEEVKPYIIKEEVEPELPMFLVAPLKYLENDLKNVPVNVKYNIPIFREPLLPLEDKESSAHAITTEHPSVKLTSYRTSRNTYSNGTKEIVSLELLITTLPSGVTSTESSNASQNTMTIATTESVLPEKLTDKLQSGMTSIESSIETIESTASSKQSGYRKVKGITDNPTLVVIYSNSTVSETPDNQTSLGLPSNSMLSRAQDNTTSTEIKSQKGINDYTTVVVVFSNESLSALQGNTSSIGEMGQSSKGTMSSESHGHIIWSNMTDNTPSTGITDDFISPGTLGITLSLGINDKSSLSKKQVNITPPNTSGNTLSSEMSKIKFLKDTPENIILSGILGSLLSSKVPYNTTSLTTSGNMSTQISANISSDALKYIMSSQTLDNKTSPGTQGYIKTLHLLGNTTSSETSGKTMSPGTPGNVSSETSGNITTLQPSGNKSSSETSDYTTMPQISVKTITAETPGNITTLITSGNTSSETSGFTTSQILGNPMTQGTPGNITALQTSGNTSSQTSGYITTPVTPCNITTLRHSSITTSSENSASTLIFDISSNTTSIGNQDNVTVFEPLGNTTSPGSPSNITSSKAPENSTLLGNESNIASSVTQGKSKSSVRLNSIRSLGNHGNTSSSRVQVDTLSSGSPGNTTSSGAVENTTSDTTGNTSSGTTENRASEGINAKITSSGTKESTTSSGTSGNTTSSGITENTTSSGITENTISSGITENTASLGIRENTKSPEALGNTISTKQRTSSGTIVNTTSTEIKGNIPSSGFTVNITSTGITGNIPLSGTEITISPGTTEKTISSVIPGTAKLVEKPGNLEIPKNQGKLTSLESASNVNQQHRFKWNSRNHITNYKRSLVTPSGTPKNATTPSKTTISEDQRRTIPPGTQENNLSLDADITDDHWKTLMRSLTENEINKMNDDEHIEYKIEERTKGDSMIQEYFQNSDEHLEYEIEEESKEDPMMLVLDELKKIEEGIEKSDTRLHDLETHLGIDSEEARQIAMNHMLEY